jgi:hypothetical protein
MDPQTQSKKAGMHRVISHLIAASALVMAGSVKARAADPPLHVDPAGRYDECSVKFSPGLTQGAFRSFAREFGSVSAFKQGTQASTLGKGKVSFSAEMFTFPLEDKEPKWNDTFVHPHAEHELGSRQNFPKFTLRAGVTDKLDVGAYFTRNPLSNYGWLGIDAKYQVLAASQSRPIALAVRGAYTKTLYVDDMDMHALTADLSAERRFARGLRPYLGLGGDAVFVRETSDAVALRGETTFSPHLFGGLAFSFWRYFTLGAEVALGALPSQQVNLAVVY